MTQYDTFALELLVLLVICLYPLALSPAGRNPPTPPYSMHKKRHLAVSHTGTAPCVLEGLCVRS